MDEILKRLDDLERLVVDQRIYLKEVLTFNEGCSYCDFTASHMYKLTSNDTIPHYKPNGKMIFFRRSELDTWLLRKRNFTQDEFQQAISSYLLDNSNLEKLKVQWMDSQEVMQTLHISKRKLQMLRDKGTLPFGYIQKKIYYKISDVEALLEKSYSSSKSEAHGTN